MYQVIADAKKNIQSYELSGTIDGAAFTGDNVLRGSFKISDQCSDSSNFDLGFVHIGVLTATFMNVEIERNDWKGVEIIPEVTIGLTTIPLGKWYVDSVEHEGNLHDVKAYNAMARLDIPPSFSAGSNGDPYDILRLLCQECHVELGMTRAEVEALPNGNLPFFLHTQGDIETWRDVLYWLAKGLCSFGTIDRQGRLVLRTFHTETDDTFPADARIAKSSYGDEIMTYTGIYINVDAEETAKYYAADPDDGYSLSIGSNPFFQGSEAQRQVYAENILAGLANIQYNFCKVSLPFGIHYDLGDVLSFPGGSGSATNKFCLMQYTWTYGGTYEMRGIPVNKKAKSRSDKDIQGLLDKVSKDEVASYEVKNTSPINIGSGENKKIITVRMVSKEDTKAQIHVEVDLKSTAITPADTIEVEDGVINLADVWEGINDSATKGIVSYLINSEEAEIHPTETWIDGDHVLHLMYILGLTSGISTSFDVYLKAQGGAIDIDRGGAWLYAQGVGLAGDGKWNGAIVCSDDAIGWELIEGSFTAAAETLNVSLQTPIGIIQTDAADDWTIGEISMETANDACSITLKTWSLARGTQDGNVRGTWSGAIRYTEGDTE